MPDRNFEQQARNMTNGFEMKPKPEVWQNVRNAIQEPKRKRRFVLWWWILPLGLLGGSIALYTFNKGDKETQGHVKTNTIHQTDMDKKTIHPEQLNGQQINTEKGKGNGAIAKTVFLHNSTKGNHKQLKAIKRSNDITNKEEKIIKEAFDENATGTRKIKESSDIIGIELNQNITTPTPTINNNKHVNESIVKLQDQPNLVPKSSLNSRSLNQDSIRSATAINTNSVSANKSDAAHINQQKKHTGWHWGILAEGGIATRKSSLFSLADMEKSLNDPSTLPNSNGSGSSIGGLPQSNGFYYNNTVNHGLAFGLGIASQKRLSKWLDFFADAAYHYQSFNITTAVYKDSLVLNNSFTSFAGSYRATQKFHFVSLFAGINWHFINAKYVQFGISVGADNLLLLAVKQKFNGINSVNFSSLDAIQMSNSFSTSNNYYKYQPSLLTGILINIQTGDRQLQFVPFVRSSLRPFDKNTTSNNNHLFSAGLRAIYFFK
jgi:hypothetical protein